MARKKTITETQILNTAYQLVIAEGFKSFTARNIARHLNCSTQPIYLEFNSMGELKDAVMARIQHELTTQLSKRYTADPIVDMGLAYVEFASQNAQLYQAIFIDDHFGIEDMRQFAYSAAEKRFADYAPAAGISTEQKHDIISALWIVAAGITELMASGFVFVTPQQQIDMLQAVLDEFVKKDHLAQTSEFSVEALANE